MPAYDPDFFNIDPYYDDFDESKKFLKMLFRPGVALQARELSQIQSILQNQVERFGNFVLKDGSMVFGGQITEIETDIITVEGSLSGGVPAGLSLSPNQLTDKIISIRVGEDSEQLNNFLELEGSETGLTSFARILYATQNPLTENTVLYIQYLSGESFSDPEAAMNDITVQGFGVDGITFTGSLTGNPEKGLVISVDEGIRYTNGYFVAHEAQRIGVEEIEYNQANEIVSVSYSNPNSSVGFNVVKTIVTSQEDISLRDPASGFFNFNAPGADRFKIDLVIDQRRIDAIIGSEAIDPFERKDFIEFVRVVDGNIVKKEKYAELGDLENTLARRTYDESGHYVVNPFDISLKNFSNDSETINSVLGSGKAYIFGYEFESISPVTLSHELAREFRPASDSVQYGFSLGPYIVAEISSFENGLSGFILSERPTVVIDEEIGDIPDGSGEISSNLIGTARVTNIQRINSLKYKIFLDDIDVQAGKNISTARRLFAEGNTAASFVITEEDTPATLKNTDRTSLVFDSPFGEVVREFTRYTFIVDLFLELDQLGLSFDSSGDLTINLGTQFTIPGLEQIGPNIAEQTEFEDLRNSPFVRVISRQKGVVGGDVKIAGGSNPKTIIIEGATAGGTTFVGNDATIVVSCLINTNVSNNRRSKTRNTGTVEIGYTGPFDSPSGSQNVYYGYVKKNGNFLTDVHSLEITGFNALPLEKRSYIFDNGQRETYYDFSKIIVNFDPNEGGLEGITQGTAVWFEHSGGGPFVGGGGNFSSYQSNYDSIPSFTTSGGKTVELRNSIDFRPVRVGDIDSFTLTGPYQLKSFVSDSFEHSVKYSYWLPRIDKIVLTKDRRFDVITGTPSEFPVTPSDNPNAMTLYTLRFNPYTFDENDISIIQEDNRRFTMKDIGNLERRVENLEYYSTLSHLEQEAKNTPIFDEFGFEIEKKAIVVDQFTGTEVSDIENPDFFCSFDRENKELRPPFETDEIGERNLETIAEGLTLNDSVLTFDYDLITYIENNKSNSRRKVNSNGNSRFNGIVKLSPSCDPWIDTEKKPYLRTNFNGENDSWKVGNVGYRMNFNFWGDNWFGKSSVLEPLSKRRITKRNYDDKSFKFDKIRSFSLPQSNLSTNGDSVVDRSIVPSMRKNREIQVEATGLMPNRTHRILFDGVDQGITLSSDSTGNISHTLSLTAGTIPSDVYAGKKLIRIVDGVESPNEIENSISSADGFYIVSGQIKDSESIEYVKPLITRKEAANSENVSSDAILRDSQRADQKSKLSNDNIAQIFSVNKSQFSLGLFLKEVDIFFSAWPTETSGNIFGESLPIKLLLKPVVNGFPSPSKIIAESLLVASNILQDGKGTFEFSYPVYLPPGDYAVELETNSNLYEIDTYTLPSSRSIEDTNERENILDTNIGSMILPKNLGPSVMINNEVFKITIRKCAFIDGETKIQYYNIDDEYGSRSSQYSEFRSNIQGALLDSRYCSIIFGGSNYSPNTTQMVEYSTLEPEDIGVQLRYIDQNVSPALHIDASNFVFHLPKMSSASFANETFASDSRDLITEKTNTQFRNVTTPRYITKSISSLTPCTKLVVLFDKNQPAGTDVEVYVKKIPANSTFTLDEAPYELVERKSRETNVVPSDEFFPTRHELDSPDFSTFSVKIVFTRGNDVQQSYPSIKNLRIIAC